MVLSHMESGRVGMKSINQSTLSFVSECIIIGGCQTNQSINQTNPF